MKLPGVPGNDREISTNVVIPGKSSDEIGVNVSDDASADDSLVDKQLINKKESDRMPSNDDSDAIEKGESPNILSILLSWESEVEYALNCIGTIELDTSFASTILVENTTG